MMKHMDPVRAFRGLAVVYNVGNQVVGGVLMYRLYFLRQVLSQIHISGNDENKARRLDKGHQVRQTVLYKWTTKLLNPTLGCWV